MYCVLSYSIYDPPTSPTAGLSYSIYNPTTSPTAGLSHSIYNPPTSPTAVLWSWHVFIKRFLPQRHGHVVILMPFHKCLLSSLHSSILVLLLWTGIVEYHVTHNITLTLPAGLWTDSMVTVTFTVATRGWEIDRGRNNSSCQALTAWLRLLPWLSPFSLRKYSGVIETALFLKGLAVWWP